MQGASPLVVAQITDTHLLAASEGELLGVPTAESFETVMRRVGALVPRPDLLLLTGDLSQDETLASYERLAAVIAPLNIATRWLPGNHDCLEVMAEVLCQPPISAEKSLSMGGWHVVLLDSLVPGEVYGHLSSQQLRWLDERLQDYRDLPTLVALHHPPLEIASAWIDRTCLQNPEDLFAVLDRHSQVRLTVFGHVHQDFVGERRGIRYLSSPSTSVQFRPRCQQFCLDDRHGPGFRLLFLYPDGRFETSIERVPLGERLIPNLSATGY